MSLLDPKDITISLPDGGEKVFVISKFKAILGREILCKYPLSSLPKIGDYAVSQETMLKLMQHVGVRMEDGTVLALTTAALIDNHVPSPETLMKLEWATLEYNVSFLRSDGSSSFFEAILAKARPLASKILTDFLAQSSPKK